MNLGQLRFAKAAAEERSFSKAAEKCNVTQPTLSNGIALLEEEVGGRLFARTTRRVDLTPFGAAQGVAGVVRVNGSAYPVG